MKRFQTAAANVLCRIQVPILYMPTSGTRMFPDPDRFVCLDTALVAFFRRAASIDANHVRAVQIGLVFQHIEKPRLCRVLLVLGVVAGFEYRLHVQTFDRHYAVLFHKPRRKLVLKVEYFPLDPTFRTGDLSALVVPVV